MKKIMSKIINPCMCNTYEGKAKGFCKIEFENGNLSISGVIGPKRNGNAKGSCGQCVDDIRNGDPLPGWDREMLNCFCDIWEKWHLNGMRPYCQHQKELGWDQLARKEVMLYNYTLCREAMDKQKDAERASIKALKSGTVFAPTEEQVRYANLPYSITTHEKLTGEMEMLYKPRKPIYAGDKGATEIKTLGWLKPEEHPEDLLCRPCPICGYKYGTAWIKEEVPKYIIEWLFKLPEAEVEPTWI